MADLIEQLGVKCKNPKCDWQNPRPFALDLWLNHPCPKCGQILLTQAEHDYLVKIVQDMGKDLVPGYLETPRKRLKFKF